MPPKSTRPKASESTGRKCKALIWGPEGHGKTHLLGTAVGDKRTTPFAIIDFEGGVSDVLVPTLPGLGKDWFHYPVSSWDEVNSAFEEIRANPNLKGAAVDSLSELHVFALMTILDEEGSSRRDADRFEIQDYGKAMVQIRRFVRYLRDLDLHVFYTAHAKDETDPREGMIKMVNMSGKLAVEVPGMMTLSGYLALTEDENGSVHRMLLLQNYAKIRTKVRTPWGVEAPDEIEDPTIPKILDALNY